MKVALLLGSIAVFGVCVGAASMLPKFIADQRKPDETTMRRYVISRLTDSEIRELHDKAQKLFDKDAARAKAETITDDAEITQRMARCSDVVYRERQGPGGCGMPLGWMPGQYSGPSFPSAAENYEIMLMLPCYDADTVRAARKVGCLP